MLMGSGETSPTMVTPHQRIFSALASAERDISPVLIDTPFGFQENADELTAKITAYFDESVGQTLRPIRMRSRQEWEQEPGRAAQEYAALRSARWIFSGPGSPSYALSNWSGTPVAEAMHALLEPGPKSGAVVLASAASLTTGEFTIPVYEIYKVGQSPFWLQGLDLLGRATGLRTAVVPHYDNAEGGTHDTRFCYMGERRLSMMEAELPEGAFIWGVDEHTCVRIDLHEGVVTVGGRGGMTLRVRGDSRVIPSGETITLEEVAAHVGGVVRPAASAASDSTVEELEFGSLLEAGRLEDAAARWAELDAAGEDRGKLRAMVVDLASAAGARGAHDAAPFIDLLVTLRDGARRDRRWADADVIRDALAARAIEIRDGKETSEWMWA